MPTALGPGRFLGQVLRTRPAPDLSLSDLRYTAGAPRHVHERPYLCLIRRGRYTEQIGRRRRDCGPLTLAWHPPGVDHAITLESAPLRALNLEPGPDWLGWMLDHGFPTDQPWLAVGGPAAEAAARLARAFGRGADRMAVESLAAEVVAALCRPAGFEQGTRVPPWLADVSSMLDDEGGRPSLRGLAARAGVHPVHFAAVFRRVRGCSVGDYVRRRQAARARRRLADGHDSLAAVAQATGFADQSHLTRAFRRYFGVTPGRYRRDLRRD